MLYQHHANTINFVHVTMIDEFHSLYNNSVTLILLISITDSKSNQMERWNKITEKQVI